MRIPEIEIDKHATRIDTEHGTFWYSYKTLVAARIGSDKRVSQNEWSNTTGKHINAIDNGDKANRIPHAELVVWVESF